MRTLLLIFSCCIIILAACGKGKSVPKGLLSEEKMEAVLWDMMRADQFLNDYVLSRDTSADRREESIRLYRKIFALHKVSKEDFAKSFHYYMDEPTRFKTLLDSVSSRKVSLPVEPKKDSTVPIKPAVPGLQ